jgi:hypothetical protein
MTSGQKTPPSTTATIAVTTAKTSFVSGLSR